MIASLRFCIIREREGEEGGSTDVRLAKPTKYTDDLEMELGANMAVTKSLMGPRSMQTTQKHYTKISLKPASDSASKHNDYMMQIAGSNA